MLLVVAAAAVFFLVGGGGLQSAASAAAAGQGCKSRGFCCQGKNNTCRSTTLDHTREPGNGDDDQATARDEGEKKTCFCDSACLDLGDCCEDYRRFCKPVDCAVSAKWGDWGECSARCGLGVKQRTRRVIRPPLNGGKPCDSTIEKIACEGVNCKVARAPEGLEQLAETGKIIPASYGPWRKSKLYDPFRDIRKNLFDYYRSKETVNRPPYCIRFLVTEATPGCNSADHWSSGLTKGSEVCAECQTMAMHKQLGGRCLGQGVLLRETRWNAVLKSGCHGKWTMQSRTEECQCDKESATSFILL